MTANTVLKRVTVACALTLAMGLGSAATALAGTLTVTAGGTGSGTVTATSLAHPGPPPPLECVITTGTTSGTCAFAFGNEKATLVATPALGSVLKEWSSTRTLGGEECKQSKALSCTTGTLGIPGTIEATFIPTPAPPVAVTAGSSEVTAFSAALAGAVDPEGFEVSECRFEFGLTEAYGHSAACEETPAELGEGSSPVSAIGRIGPLEPGAKYHYRLVASNPGGTSRGVDGVFEAGAAPSDGCANAARRSEQGASAIILPECRAYELVSSGDSHGTPVLASGLLVAPGGERVLFAGEAIEEPSSLPGVSNGAVSERGASGWSVTPMEPDPNHVNGGVTEGVAAASAELSTVLWNKEAAGQLARGEVEWLFVNLDGSVTPASPLIVPLLWPTIKPGQYVYQGASADLSTFLFAEPYQVTLTSAEPQTAAEKSNLYEITDAGAAAASLSLVNQDGEGGAQIGGVCGAYLGGWHPGNKSTRVNMYDAVSTNGQTLYFSARPGEPASGACAGTSPVRIFRRAGQELPVEVSASECDRVSPEPPCNTANGNDVYVGASADGSKVFFTTTRQLANSDTDATSDLYMHNAAGPAGKRLTQVSAGEPVVGHTVGSGAEVLGVVAVAADGSRVYYVAKGVLAGENQAHQSPGANQDNLYVYDVGTGTTSFVATLSAGDSQLWTESVTERFAYALPEREAKGSVPGDGRFLLFLSASKLVAEDTDSVNDLYRYDSVNGELLCLSCKGAHGKGNGDFPVYIKSMPTSDPSSGLPANAFEVDPAADEAVTSVVFASQERLLPEFDTNNAYDAYEWRETGPGEGELSLVSGLSGELGLSEVASGGVEAPAISPSGQDIYFVTATAGLPRDADSVTDLYDARVGGGFPEASTAAPPCEGEACKAPSSAAQTFGVPSTVTFTGPGNVPLLSGDNSRHRGSQRVKHATRSKKLAKALKVCGKKPLRRRKSCRIRARKRYAAKSLSASANHKGRK